VSLIKVTKRNEGKTNKVSFEIKEKKETMFEPVITKVLQTDQKKKSRVEHNKK
jgi:hypothetical protein